MAGQGECRGSSQQPACESHILRERVEPRPAPLILCLFSETKDVAEPRTVDPRHGAVGFHLLGKLAFEARTVEQIPDPAPELTHRGLSYAVRSTVRIAAFMRS